MRLVRWRWDGADLGLAERELRELTPTLEHAGAEVATIVADVRVRGDEAIAELEARFSAAPAAELRVDPARIAAALAGLDDRLRDSLEAARRNIAAVAAAELRVALAPAVAELEQGHSVEVRSSPVGAVGVYAPGGRGAYPSSVLMCAVPARAAGVARVAVVSPPADRGEVDATVLAACAMAGVDEVYAVGGAQAIAALAYGTETIDPVDVIAGPGSRYVTEAKRQVCGAVGIDGLAGPSELVVVADSTADPEQVALDLLAQGEHGDDSPLIVLSPDDALLDAIAARAATLASDRPTVADAPLALVAVPAVADALALADAYAPEHLELAFEGAGADAARDRVAGCVFVGPGGATAFGDYAAGSNHVLPTGAAARFGGPLGPSAFLRRTSVVSVPTAAASALAPDVAVIAAAEGFPVHGESALARAAAKEVERDG